MSTGQPPVPFNDLRAVYQAHKGEIDAAVARVLESGWYILGSEVAAFEQEFALWTGAAGCVGVNSGTDALLIALRACGIGAGDEVITVAHTAVATVAAIALAGATPVLVDIDPATYTMDPGALARAITPRTRAVIPVHLYGQPADIEAICAIAAQAGVLVIEDCAQAHGARVGGRPAGSFGSAACYSFYPTKNLGALGDGGAITSGDPAILDRARLLREYGWTPAARYVSQVPGANSRLDELQAAVLRVRLGHLAAENEARRKLAARYDALLPGGVRAPWVRPGAEHVYHLYVVEAPERDRTRAALQARGIGTGIHYPVPIHLQPAYLSGGVVAHDLSATERAAASVLSLPMYPSLRVEQVEQVADALRVVLERADG